MKRVLSLCFIGLMVSFVQAQEKKFQRSDIELLNFGVAFGASDFGEYKAHPGVFLNVEYRYHIKPLPLDFGIQFSQTGIPRAPDGESTSDADQVGRCMLVADYNFRRNHKINPFAGIGFGWYYGMEARHTFWDLNGEMIPVTIYPEESHLNGVMPRVGVRFFRHLNVTLDYLIAGKYNRHARFGIGFYF
ncbi:MAG: outer membrane beta-barrel protein [Prolixibacteraceae bacterium]